MFDYKGKVVAITGASSGLGKQMAEGFAQCGADLVLMARRVERLEKSAKEWSEKYGINVFPVKCDVTSTESINEAVAAIEEKFGHCEVILNCAGGEKGTGTPIGDFKKEDWEYTLALDLTSIYECTQAFTNLMKRGMEAGKQTYSISEGIAHINGYEAEIGHSVRLITDEAFDLALKEKDIPCVIDAVIDSDDRVLPMVAPGANISDFMD